MKSLIMTRDHASKSIARNKTMTRRTLKIDFPADADEVFYFQQPNPSDEQLVPTGIWARRNGKHEDDTSGWVRCLGPSEYNVGELRWIKESGCRYRRYGQMPGEFQIDRNDSELSWPKLNALFYPRWASRLTIEITDVRIERLQEIKENDVWLEGVHEEWPTDINGDAYVLTDNGARKLYRPVWESINGKGSWDANPWVYVITFRVVKP
jgi:hypothetical protein